LDDEFAMLASNQSLYLQINRLSGVLPSSVLSSLARNLSVLEGNLFSCTVDQSLKRDLPRFDPERHIYSCGSETVNRSFYLCLVISFSAVAIVVGWLQFVYLPSAVNRKHELESSFAQSSENNNNLRRSRASGRLSNSSLPRESSLAMHASFSVQESLKYWQAWMSDIALWISLLKVSDKEFPNICVFSDFLAKLRKLFNSLCLIAILVLMPIYALLSITFAMGSYRHKYAWTLSAIFLSGFEAGAVLQLFLSLLLSCTFVLFFRQNFEI
jgi:hypothetical protein